MTCACGHPWSMHSTHVSSTSAQRACGRCACVVDITADPPSPRIGDVVLYRSHGTRDGRHEPAHLPLIVVEVHADDTRYALVSGWVHYVDGLRYHDRVRYSGDESERATWLPR